MAGSPRRMRLEALVREIAPCLQGWKVYGVALAREPEAGLWQVVDFQPDKDVTSWRFTLNLGLYEEGLRTLLDGAAMDTQRPSTDSCQLRVRMGQLIDDRDRWWDLPSHGPTDGLGRELCLDLAKFATPDLDRFRSRQAIVDAWKHDKTPRPFWGRRKGSPWFRSNPMVLAGLLQQVGRVSEAIDVADAEAASSVGHPKEQWCKAVVSRLKEADGGATR